MNPSPPTASLHDPTREQLQLDSKKLQKDVSPTFGTSPVVAGGGSSSPTASECGVSERTNVSSNANTPEVTGKSLSPPTNNHGARGGDKVDNDNGLLFASQPITQSASRRREFGEGLRLTMPTAADEQRQREIEAEAYARALFDAGAGDVHLGNGCTYRRELPLEGDDAENENGGRGGLASRRPAIHASANNSTTERRGSNGANASSGVAAKGGKEAANSPQQKHAPQNRTVAGVKAMITTPSHTFWFWSLQPHSYKGLPPKPHASAMQCGSRGVAAVSPSLPLSPASSTVPIGVPNAAAMVMKNNDTSAGAVGGGEGGGATPVSPVPTVRSASAAAIQRGAEDDKAKQQQKGSGQDERKSNAAPAAAVASKASAPVQEALRNIMAHRKERRNWEKQERKAKLKKSDNKASDNTSVHRSASAVSRPASFGGESAAMRRKATRGSSSIADDNDTEACDENNNTISSSRLDSPLEDPASPLPYGSSTNEPADDSEGDSLLLRREDPKANASALGTRRRASASTARRGKVDEARHPFAAKHQDANEASPSASFLTKLQWATQNAFNKIDGKLSSITHRFEDEMLKRKIKGRDAKNRKRWEDHFFWLLSEEQQAAMKGQRKGNAKAEVSAKKQAGQPQQSKATSGPDNRRLKEDKEEFIASYECWVVHQGGRTRGYAMLSTNYLAISCENGFLLDAIPLKKVVSYQRSLVYDEHNSRWCRFAAQHETKGHCLCAPQFAPLWESDHNPGGAPNTAGEGSAAPPTVGLSDSINSAGAAINAPTINHTSLHGVGGGAQLLNESLPASLRSGGIQTANTTLNGTRTSTITSAAAAATTASSDAAAHPNNNVNNASQHDKDASIAPTALQIFTSRGQVYQLWGFFSNTVPVKVKFAFPSINTTSSASSLGGQSKGGSGRDGSGSRAPDSVTGDASLANTPSLTTANDLTGADGKGVWWYDVSSIKKSLNVSCKNKRGNNPNGLFSGSLSSSFVGGNGSHSANKKKKKAQKKPSLHAANAAIAAQRNQRGHLANFEALFAEAWHAACNKPSSGCGGVPHAGLEYVDAEGYVFVKEAQPKGNKARAEQAIQQQQAPDCSKGKGDEIPIGAGEGETIKRREQAHAPQGAMPATHQRPIAISDNSNSLTPKRTPLQQRRRQNNQNSNKSGENSEQSSPALNKSRAQQAAREMGAKSRKKTSSALSSPAK